MQQMSSLLGKVGLEVSIRHEVDNDQDGLALGHDSQQIHHIGVFKLSQQVGLPQEVLAIFIHGSL